MTEAMKSADSPLTRVSECGCPTMIGGLGSTESIAVPLATAPNSLLTMTEYAPLCHNPTFVNVNTDAVAPGRLVPLNCHWYSNGVDDTVDTENSTSVPASANRSTGSET